MLSPQIAEKFAPGSRLLKSWRLSGGVSAEMTALEIKERDGRTRRLILRTYGKNRPNQDPFVEYKTLRAAHSLGLATPQALLYDNSGELSESPYMIIEFIPGEVTFAPTDVAAHMRQIAEHLAQIHTVDISKVDLSFLQRRDTCAELSREPTIDRDSFGTDQIRNILEAAAPPATHSFALLHGDYWPGNTLWQKEKLVAVIDWEDAELGNPLYDLARSRSEITWIFGPAALDTFTRHYQSLTAIDYSQLPYWDLCAALRQLRLANNDYASLAAYFTPYGRSDITPTTIKQNLSLFIAQAIQIAK